VAVRTSTYVITGVLPAGSYETFFVVLVAHFGRSRVQSGDSGRGKEKNGLDWTGWNFSEKSHAESILSRNGSCIKIFKVAVVA
jgi:hypothetical protein